MSNVEFVEMLYAAFAAGDIEKILAHLHPEVRWTETAGAKRGGEFIGPQAVLQGVFAKIPRDYEHLGIDVERLIDGGDCVVMQGHYTGRAKRGGEVHAAVAHVFEVRDGALVRFDQYVDSATLNAAIT